MTRPLWSVAQSADAFGRPDLPLLSMSAAFGLRQRPEEGGRAASEDLSGYRVVEPGWLVVNKLSARDGALAVSEMHGIVSPAYWVLRLDEDLVWPRFLHYYLRSSAVLGEIWRRSKFMPPAQFDLPWDQFRSLLLDLPALEQQRRIAAFLDDQVARLDDTQQRLSRLSELVEGRRDAALLAHIDAVTTSTVPLRRLLARAPQYGLVPEQVLDAGAGPRYIRTTDIADNGTLRNDEPKAVPMAAARPYLLQPGDVLVSRSGSIGKCHVVREDAEPAVFAGYLIRLRLAGYGTDLLRLFFRTSRFRAQVAVGVVHSTIDNFNAERYKEVLVPQVLERHQSGLVADLLRVEAAVEEAVQATAKVGELLEERKRALITACVTGEFDVSAASDRAGDAALAQLPLAYAASEGE